MSGKVKGSALGIFEHLRITHTVDILANKFSYSQRMNDVNVDISRSCNRIDACL